MSLKLHAWHGHVPEQREQKHMIDRRKWLENIQDEQHLRGFIGRYVRRIEKIVEELF